MSILRKKSFKYLLVGLIYLTLILIIFSPHTQHNRIVSEDGFVEVYFCQEVNCSFLLNQFISNDQKPVCAFYDLENEDIIQTIIQQNITTKLFDVNYNKHLLKNKMFQPSNSPNNFNKTLKPNNKIPPNIIPVSSKGLMHNKFCVNNEFVFTGSWNPTFRGTYKNNNYVVFIKSENLGSHYKQAFYSINNKTIAESSLTNLSGTFIENYFCPDNNCEEHILNTLKTATKSIKVLAFSFTSKNIASVLIDKQKVGINVSVLFEKSRISKYSVFDMLQQNNISTFLDSNPYVMHEKVFIIDETTVIIGSYNPTSAANKINDENILIIHNENITKIFINEFNNLINQSNQESR